MATGTLYGRTLPGGRVHHIIRDGRTLCGQEVTQPGWATWPPALNRRVDLRPTCAACQAATR